MFRTSCGRTFGRGPPAHEALASRGEQVVQSPLADGRNSLFDVAELASCTVTPTRCLGRRVDAPSAAARHPSTHGGLVCAVTTPTVAILTGSLVGRPVRNGDARLKHTATERTAAVPVAEAEPTKALFCGAVLATVRNTREAPLGQRFEHEAQRFCSRQARPGSR